ncbi:MAG TPA: hypothetical protein VIP07_10350 [Candidatus Limnocylindria bacterium]|jgi:hypothetical protein
MYTLRLTLVAFVLASLALVQGTTASAASGYSLFGDATLVHPGNASNTAVQLSSVGATYGGVDFDTPSGMILSELQNLSTDYKFTSGSCSLGSPRFQINVDGHNIFVYIGPPPNYTGCTEGVWLNTGDLLEAALFVDTSQLPGGTFYDTWAGALVKYGSHAVTGIQLVADSGTQIVLVDNVMINSTTYTFEPAPTKDSCKKGGWESFTSSPGPFKNQGDCVSFFANGKNDSGE